MWNPELAATPCLPQLAVVVAWQPMQATTTRFRWLCCPLSACSSNAWKAHAWVAWISFRTLATKARHALCVFWLRKVYPECWLMESSLKSCGQPCWTFNYRPWVFPQAFQAWDCCKGFHHNLSGINTRSHAPARLALIWSMGENWANSSVRFSKLLFACPWRV